MDEPITQKQFDYIAVLAKNSIELTVELIHKKLARELTKAEASLLIDALVGEEPVEEQEILDWVKETVGSRVDTPGQDVSTPELTGLEFKA